MPKSVNIEQCAIYRCDRLANMNPRNPDVRLCAWHFRMWQSFIAGWKIGSGIEVKVSGGIENWDELFRLFKDTTEGQEGFTKSCDQFMN